MAYTTKQKKLHQTIRARRVRARVKGTTERPRLTVKRSLKHIYVQVIDDTLRKTIVSASDKDFSQIKGKLPTEIAREVGKIIAERAKSFGIQSVVFDRGPYLYHGRVAAIAEGAREAGLAI